MVVVPVSVALPLDAGGFAGGFARRVVSAGVGGVVLPEWSGRPERAERRVVHREGERPPLLLEVPYRSGSPSWGTGPVFLRRRTFPTSPPPLPPFWLVVLVAPGRVAFGALRRLVGRRKRALGRWLVGISLASTPAITLPTLLRRWPIRVALVPSSPSVLWTRWAETALIPWLFKRVPRG